MREWCGRGARARPHWNIGVHVYDSENVDPKDVASAIDDTLRKKFPTAQITKSPKFKNLLEK
jgi:hypothetical protein